MKNLETKSEIQKIAKRFDLKGRSKIENLNDLLKTMKDQEPEARKVLMSCIRLEKNLIKRTNKQLKELPTTPAKPLKGRGYERDESLSFNFKDELENLEVPSNHSVLISQRRKKGFFSWSEAFSPESSIIIRKFVGEKAKIWDKFNKYQSPKTIALRIEKDKVLRNEIIITNDEKGDLKDFFKNETHPAPKWVYDLKVKSGVSWNALRNLYQ